MVVMIEEETTREKGREGSMRSLQHSEPPIAPPILGQSENLNILPGGVFSALLAKHQDSLWR